MKDFWSRVKKKPKGCWEWQGTRDRAGYGIAPGGKRAHRVAWELAYGEIPKGKTIRHVVCHNPPCVNPKHLKPGSDYDNALDTIRSGRPTHPMQQWIAGFGQRADAKYSDPAEAKRRGQANYRRANRRRLKREAAGWDRGMEPGFWTG